MRSFHKTRDDRRRIYLALVGSVESKLREAFGKAREARGETQAALADKLRVNRSVVNRRLNGGENMTLQTVADMVWALGCAIEVDIFDPADRPDRNNVVCARPVAASPGVVSVGSWGSVAPPTQVSVVTRELVTAG